MTNTKEKKPKLEPLPLNEAIDFLVRKLKSDTPVGTKTARALLTLESLRNITVICFVEGGNVQGARASHPVTFEVNDADNLEAAEAEDENHPYFGKAYHEELKALDERYENLEFGVY